MLGFFNFFVRAESLKALDQALRDFDLYPRVLPEAVKLAAVRLMQKASDAEYVLRDEDYQRAAELLSYAILGPDQFVASNTLAEARLAEKRLEEAIDSGDSLDAEIVLLTVHSGVVHSKIAEQFEIEVGE